MNEVAELESLNEMLTARMQKMITEHKQQLETQHRELEVMCSHMCGLHIIVCVVWVRMHAKKYLLRTPVVLYSVYCMAEDHVIATSCTAEALFLLGRWVLYTVSGLYYLAT